MAESLRSFGHALRTLDKVEVYPNERNVPPDSFDLVIADEPEDAARSARVRMAMFMVVENLQGLVTMEEASNQAIDWRRDAPLLQHVDFSNVVFLDQSIVTEFQEGAFVNLGYDVLLFGPKGPLLLEERQDNRVTFHCLFHTDRSTFPYRVGFPVFVANLVQLARQEAGLSETRALSTGTLPGLTMAPNQSVRVVEPNDQVTEIQSTADGKLPGLDARKVGLYRYEGADDVVRGANLLSLAETSLTQVEAVEFREARAVAEAQAIETDRPLWQWLAAIGLFVLLLEWWVFQRRPGGWRKAVL